jgi:hypothetical protein
MSSRKVLDWKRVQPKQLCDAIETTWSTIGFEAISTDIQAESYAQQLVTALNSASTECAQVLRLPSRRLKSAMNTEIKSVIEARAKALEKSEEAPNQRWRRYWHRKVETYDNKLYCLLKASRRDTFRKAVESGTVSAAGAFKWARMGVKWCIPRKSPHMPPLTMNNTICNTGPEKARCLRDRPITIELPQFDPQTRRL